MKSLLIIFGLLISFPTLAQVFGPSAKEVRFNYTAEFTTHEVDKDPVDQAYTHSIHLYGILSTPELTKKYGVNPKRIGGMGVPRSDIDLTIRKVETNSDGSIRIRYSASGKMLLHLAAAEKVLKDGSITVPMPDDLEAIYDEKCTDEHYNSLGDYWYFWNPFRKGCKYLSDEPYTTPVEIKFNPATEPNLDVMARLDLLRGDNRNGREFLIYTFHGFGDSPSKNDDGRLNYESFHEFLRSEGFEERIESKSFTRPRHEFTKTLTLADGSDIDVRIRSILIDTAIESKSEAFAKYFKQAVLEADVIFYAGHSGLGGNLDIPSLEEKAGEFEIDPKKRQLFYFESCSSYSYYLVPFRETKTKSKIDILSNGLSSYFETTPLVTEAFFRALLDVQEVDQSWMSIMKSIEKPLKGGSYLLNVGGI